jgi:hypothetical protein
VNRILNHRQPKCDSVPFSSYVKMAENKNGEGCDLAKNDDTRLTVQRGTDGIQSGANKAGRKKSPLVARSCISQLWMGPIIGTPRHFLGLLC